jgi:ferritin-like metal-binding protein YciE
MADLTARDTKLIQYLNEAYAKEKELETALQAHAKEASGRKTYKQRLQDHLKETKAQARGLERRIKQLGGKTDGSPAAKVTAAASKAAAAAKAPVHALRGTGEAEKLLKNAKTELWNEYEEIGNYVAIETLAQELGDTETEKLAREYRRQEERMASFLVKLLPQLTKAVAKEEIPAAERRTTGGGTRRRTTRSRSTTRRSTSRAASSSSRSWSSRASSSTRARRSTATSKS